jgi:signal transduction histidine kinase/ligand-binding sensor domain-containing protein
MNWRRLFLLSFFACFSGYVVLSQPVRKIAVKHKWSPSNGLSSYNVNKILQDKYGYIWISTQDGLNRFDGRSFIWYSKSSDTIHRLLGNVINDMVEDTLRKMLWVTSSYGGINGIDLVTGAVTRSVKTSEQKPAFASEWLKCIALIGDHLWVGTLNGLHFYSVADNNFIEVRQSEKILSRTTENIKFNVNAIVPDNYGHVWVSLPELGLAVYDAATRTIIHLYSADSLKIHEDIGYLQFFSRFISINDSSFLWATDHGFKLLTYSPAGELRSVKQDIAINRYFANSAIFTCAADKQKNIWFSTFDRLYVTRLDDHRFSVVHDITPIPGNDYMNTVINIFFDRDDQLWIGTQYGAGLCDQRSPAIIPYYRDKESDTKISHAYYIHPVNDTLLYIGAQDGVYSVDVAGDRIRNLGSFRRCNYIFETPYRHHILSCDQGLFVINGHASLQPVDAIYPELKSIRHDMINSSVRFSDSTIYLSSEKNNGPFVWNTQLKQVRRLDLGNDPVFKSVVNKLFRDKENRIWILFDNVIAVHEPETHTTTKLNLQDPQLGIPLNIFMDMCETSAGYWLAVYGKGVVLLDHQLRLSKVFSSAEGLANTGVYNVIPLDDTMVFATTNYGLYSIETNNGRVRQLLTSDGLNTNSFEENCGIIKDSIIYVGGEQGLSRINAHLLRFNYSPPTVFINSVRCETQSGLKDIFDLHLNKFVIPAAARQTLIRFSAINYSAPQSVTYAYRINELQNDWIELGTTNFINLIGLSPGAYTLFVKAANENGVWSEPQSLAITVRPHWYQTMLFKILVWVTLLGLIYAIYRYRIRQIEKQQRIRKEISADLHDDIGSTLNSAKIFTHLAKNETDKDELLTQIDQTISEATTSMRDIIWVLDDTQDTLQDLIDRINKFWQPVSIARNVKIDCFVPLEFRSQQLTKKEKKTFFLIAKEAINNSIKHSSCTHIRIEVVPDGHRFSLRISDNGRGFREVEIPKGYGLSNMRNRAQQIGYTLFIESKPDGGVTLTLEKDRKAGLLAINRLPK